MGRCRGKKERVWGGRRSPKQKFTTTPLADRGNDSPCPMCYVSVCNVLVYTQDEVTSQQSVVTVTITICMLWGNTACCVQLSRYSNKTESVVLTKCTPYYHYLTKKVMSQ